MFFGGTDSLVYSISLTCVGFASAGLDELSSHGQGAALLPSRTAPLAIVAPPKPAGGAENGCALEATCGGHCADHRICVVRDGPRDAGLGESNQSDALVHLALQ